MKLYSSLAAFPASPLSSTFPAHPLFLPASLPPLKLAPPPEFAPREAKPVEPIHLLYKNDARGTERLTNLDVSIVRPCSSKISSSSSSSSSSVAAAHCSQRS